jgi:hypothetical protein
MRTTIRRDRIVDLVIGNRRSFAIHFGFVMIADHAALSPAVTSWTVGRKRRAAQRCDELAAFGRFFSRHSRNLLGKGAILFSRASAARIWTGATVRASKDPQPGQLS